MEVRPGGPLSYDLDVPDRDPSAQRGIIIGLLTTVAAWVVLVVGGWFALGVFADPRAVSRLFPLLIVVAAVGATLTTTRRTMRHARRNAVAIISGVSLVGAILAHQQLTHVKPTIPQIRQYLDDVALPPGYTVVSEETRGDRLCRNGCPRIDRIYATPPGDSDPVKTMVLAMFDNGWDRASDVPPELATTAQRGEIFAQLSETAPQTVRVTASRQS
jgi:hypothetical protein